MKTLKYKKDRGGVLTSEMDIGTEEFKDFQQFILSKSRSQTERQKIKVELMSLRIRMEDYLNMEEGEEITIGDFLRAFLAATRIRQKKFAEYIGLKPSNFSKLLNGDRKLSLEQAFIFGSIFEIEPLMWVRIQAMNEFRNVSKVKKKMYSKYRLKELLND